MSLHPSETADPFHSEKAAARSGIQRLMLFALGVMGCVLVAGCKGRSDPLAGRTAGEQRSFGLGHGVDIDFRWAPGGSFMMGSPAGESARSDGENQRNVMIRDGFWIAEVETTVLVWRKVMGSEPAMKVSGNQLPVACVSWYECRDFLKRLQSPGSGWRYELPTEAQWEYACRAGRNSANARPPAELGWIDANSGGRSHPVGRKPANAWSLRDMHGNIAEWCRDAVGSRGYERSIRGGSWDSDLNALAEARNSDTPFLKINRVGFRLVLVREQAPTKGISPSLTSNQ